MCIKHFNIYSYIQPKRENILYEHKYTRYRYCIILKYYIYRTYPKRLVYIYSNTCHLEYNMGMRKYVFIIIIINT